MSLITTPPSTIGSTETTRILSRLDWNAPNADSTIRWWSCTASSVSECIFDLSSAAVSRAMTNNTSDESID
jgi:hypothetical protein